MLKRCNHNQGLPREKVILLVVPIIIQETKFKMLPYLTFKVLSIDDDINLYMYCDFSYDKEDHF